MSLAGKVNRSTAAGVAVVVIAVLLTYSPTFNVFFIKDDLVLLSSARTDFPEGFGRPWLGGFYRPVSELLFGLQFAVFGLTAWPYHIVSLFFHLTATGFVYGISKRLLRNCQHAFASAFLFALHPIHTECVSWISGQMSLLAGLLAVALLYGLMAIQFTIPKALLLCMVAFAGFCTYETFIAIPAVWTFLWWLERRSIQWLLGPLAFAAAIIGWRTWVVGIGTGPYPFELSLLAGFVNLGYYFYLFLGGTAIGGRLLAYNFHDTLNAENFVQIFTPLLLLSQILALCMIAVMACKFRRGSIEKDKVFLVAVLVLTIVAALLPVWFMDSRPRRITYVATSGYVALFVCLCAWLLARTRTLPIHRVGFAIIVTIVGGTTYARNRDWTDAGDVHQAMLNAIVSVVESQKCDQVIVDVPDLISDAQFFHSASAEFWVQHNLGVDVLVRHAYEPSSRIQPKLKTCALGLFDHSGIKILPEPTAKGAIIYRPGNNWISRLPSRLAPLGPS